MKYKIIRAVQIEYKPNQAEQIRAEKARLLAIHLVRQLEQTKRKEESNETQKENE